MWDGDTDSLIEFLLDYRVIIPLDSQITENKISKPTNLKDAIKSLTEYMVSQGMNIEPLPKLIKLPLLSASRITSELELPLSMLLKPFVPLKLYSAS